MSGPSVWVKKPVSVQAMQLTEENIDDVEQWAEACGAETFPTRDGTMLIRTLEGDMRASVGDWIIKGVAGEFYPCKPDIFVETYDPEQEEQ